MADDSGMDRAQMWNLLPSGGPPGPPTQPKAPPPGFAKAPPAAFGPPITQKAMPHADVYGREVRVADGSWAEGKAKGKGKGKNKGKGERRRPELPYEQPIAARATGAVNSRAPRWGAGQCAACGGWYVPRMHAPGGSGFCLSPPHVCLRSQVVKEESARSGRPCHVIHEEHKRAYAAQADPPPPWRDEPVDATWPDVLDVANDEAEDLGRVPVVLREAPAFDDSLADASIGSNSLGVSIGSSGVTGVALSEDSDEEGVLAYAGEQDRRSRSPSPGFTLSEHDKAIHAAKAVALDQIADMIRDWAQDMRDVAAGQVKKLVDTKFPPDLIDSILHSASALRGKYAHTMSKADKSSEDIQESVAVQASNIMREVALMAKKARKRPQGQKRDRSPSPPMPQRRRSPPARASGSRDIEGCSTHSATSKAPPAAKEPKTSKKDDRKDGEKQRRRAAEKRRDAQKDRKQSRRKPSPSSPSSTPPREPKKERRHRSPLTPH